MKAVVNIWEDDHHFRREDRTLLWRRIARHLEAKPEELEIALENIARWRKSGRLHPGPLDDWEGRIRGAMASPQGMRELVVFCETPNHDAEPIKSCSPFAGLSMEDWKG